MSDRYPGGLIRKTPPTITPPVDGEGGSASGIWTLEQVAYYIKEGTWPKPVLPRELYAWGRNDSGQIGDNTNINRSSPVQIGSITTWDTVSAGLQHSFAIKQDNTLWTWGRGNQGQTGVNYTATLSSPVQIGALSDWAQASAGRFISAAIRSNGTLWTFGYGPEGGLGQNNTISYSSPTQVGSLTTWLQVNAGRYSMGAIKTDGTLWTWGQNQDGKLGLGTTSINTSSPIQVGSLTNWKQINFSNSFDFTAAVKTDGTLWAWGGNIYGNLGTNNMTDYSSPVQVGALTNWAQVAVGRYGIRAIKTDGTLWSWGGGSYGANGQNNTTDYSSPVQVGSDTNWGKVASADDEIVGAIKTDGTLWTWGNNSYGALGDGSVVRTSSPTQVGAETYWENISTGTNFMVATTKG
jgi:alpha-tubulin suppressor-like RCC1 family protein